MTEKVIPVADVSQFVGGNEEERKKFVDQLGRAFHEIGFVGIKNHGIPEKLIDDFYGASKTFFALSGDVKKQYEIEGMAGQRGYTSFGIEKAKGAQTADLKEFYQFGQEVSEEEKNEFGYPPNVPVKETPDFTELGLRLYKEFEKPGRICSGPLRFTWNSRKSTSINELKMA